jgi:hypothetical protein
MTDVSKRFEQLISQSYKKLADADTIMPVKTAQGILVGDILIVSRGSIKDLYRNNELIYKDISLNEATIRIANLAAKRKMPTLCDQIYRNDQDYGRWFTEWQILKEQYLRAKESRDHDREDILYARYQDVKHRAETAKRSVLVLIKP